MWNLTNLASAAAVVLTIVAYVPYIKAIKVSQVKPHFYSWLIWSLTTLIVFFAQIAAAGGAGAWPTGVSAVITIYVAWLALRLRSDMSATRSDKGFLGAALLSLPLWFFTADPLWSVVILTTVDALGFGPTFRKAWQKPQEESLPFYAIFALRSALSIYALTTINLTTALFPGVMVVACMLMCALMWWRRRQITAVQ